MKTEEMMAFEIRIDWNLKTRPAYMYLSILSVMAWSFTAWAAAGLGLSIWPAAMSSDSRVYLSMAAMVTTCFFADIVVDIASSDPLFRRPRLSWAWIVFALIPPIAVAWFAVQISVLIKRKGTMKHFAAILFVAIVATAIVTLEGNRHAEDGPERPVAYLPMRGARYSAPISRTTVCGAEVVWNFVEKFVTVENKTDLGIHVELRPWKIEATRIWVQPRDYKVVPTAAMTGGRLWKITVETRIRGTCVEWFVTR